MAFRIGLPLLLCFLIAAPQGSFGSESPTADRFGSKVALPTMLFDVIDPNGDGVIDAVEAKKAEAALLRLSKTRQPLGQAIREALDANEDRKVDADEARRGLERAKNTYRGWSAIIVPLIEKLDADEDQEITPQEFRRLADQVGVLGPAVAPRQAHLFNRLDRDRDGIITLEEIQAASELLTKLLEVLQTEQRQLAMQKDPLYLQTQRIFTALDSNQDRRLSPEEAGKNKSVSDAFGQIDTSSDGLLSLEECFEFVKGRAN